MKKIIPLLIAFVGLALIIAALVVWLEPPEDGGLFSTAGAIISFLLGAGASIKGWMDVFKKDEPAKNETSYTADMKGDGAIAQGENSRAVGQQGVMTDQVSGIINYGTINQSLLSSSQTHRENKNVRGSTLPNQPYFFGREKELATIGDAISPESRTWGALIDGPGGIGKTALAIRAAHLAPQNLFDRKIFITAKVRELTSEGEKPLKDFSRDNYLSMLDELALELSEDEIPRLAPDERPNQLRMAMAGKKTLIVFDNLETLQEGERDRLFQFLSRLPEGNKAIATSRRRRPDVDARAIRLDRLSADEALQLMNELVKNNSRLARENEAARRKLYEITNGNPLLVKWVCGQLGREGSAMHTIEEACKFIENAPKDNDPLEYIFGDLLGTFTESETKVLASLTHFTLPAKIDWLTQMTDLPIRAAETALEDLADRSILIANNESKTFYLPPLAAQFIKTRRPEAVTQTGDALTDRAYALALQYGGGSKDYENFPILDAEWDFISAALPRLLTGDNDHLQTVCKQLTFFLDFTGRWDEGISLHKQAETCALSANDKENAGWRAKEAGWIYQLRNQPAEVLACAARAAEYWQDSTPHNKATAIWLRGIGHILNEDYPAAITAYSEVVQIDRSISPESNDVANDLNGLASAENANGDYEAAERDFREALRISKKNNDYEGIATHAGNLAALASTASNGQKPSPSPAKPSRWQKKSGGRSWLPAIVTVLQRLCSNKTGILKEPYPCPAAPSRFSRACINKIICKKRRKRWRRLKEQ